MVNHSHLPSLSAKKQINLATKKLSKIEIIMLLDYLSVNVKQQDALKGSLINVLYFSSLLPSPMLDSRLAV